MWSASIIFSMPGIAATCPPTTIFDCGESSRTMRHISRTLPTFTMIDGDADDVVLIARQLALQSLRAWESRARCMGAEIFSWIIMMPQERWNMRSEKLPCARVTWLW